MKYPNLNGRLSPRLLQLTILILTLTTIFIAFYLQYAKGQQPCPLCIMQRIAAIGLLITTLFSFYKTTLITRPVFIILQFAWVCAGLFFAGRQVWLQTLPADAIPACMPGLDILLTYFSWLDVLKALLLGGGECSQDTYHLLGLSLATWSLLYFISMCILVILAWLRSKHDRV